MSWPSKLLLLRQLSERVRFIVIPIRQSALPAPRLDPPAARCEAFRARRACLDFRSLRSVLVIVERFLMAGMIVLVRAVLVPMVVLVAVLVSVMFVRVAVSVIVGVGMFVTVSFITVFVVMGVGVSMLVIV